MRHALDVERTFYTQDEKLVKRRRTSIFALLVAGRGG